ncbi:hypothetical protein, partial [Paenisporosarcina sp. TG-14]|uniref:hypothetical protein n=1 Tax=Paenisporosarcina sp. TG-14 TaxID=1231057 RepID=UPI00035D7EBE
MGNNSLASTINQQVEESRAVSTHKFLIHHRGDHVGVASSPIIEGETVIGIYMDDNSEIEINSKADIPLGHKISLVALNKDEPVVKYGVQIGITTNKWELGD